MSRTTTAQLAGGILLALAAWWGLLAVTYPSRCAAATQYLQSIEGTPYALGDNDKSTMLRWGRDQAEHVC